MDLKEALAKVTELEAANALLTTDNATLTTAAQTHDTALKSVNDESAENRVAKQAQRKANFILKTILEKNNIAYEIKDTDLNGITFDDKGEPVGDVSYQPNTNQIKTSINTGAGEQTQMTPESIQGMSRAEIAQNWDAVAATLAAADQ